MFIMLGKLFYAFVWLFLLFNLVHPFPKPANVVANIALIAFVIMHGLQAWLLSSTMTREEREKDRFKVLRLFIFGIFETLSWKKREDKQSQ